MQLLWVICHDNGGHVTAERLSWDLARVTSKYLGSSQCWGALIGSLLYIIYDNGWWAPTEYRNLESEGTNRMPRFLSIIQKSQGSVKLSDQPWLCFCKLSGAIWITVDQNIWWWMLFRFWRWYLVDARPDNRTPYYFLLLTISQSGFTARFSIIVIFLQVYGVIWISVDQ